MLTPLMTSSTLDWMIWLVAALVSFHVLAVLAAGLAIAYPNPFRAFRKCACPADLGLVAEDVRLSSGLPGWLFTHKEATRAVLVCHGRSRSKAHMLPILALLSERWTVLSFDFPGHGGDGYGRTTIGWREATAVGEAIDLLEARGYNDIVVFGVSMGGAASLLELAHRPRPAVRGLVTDGVFADLRELLRHATARQGLPTWLQSSAIALAAGVAGYEVDWVRPVDAAGRIETPLVVLHGDRDPLALPACGDAISKAAGTTVRHYPGGHDEPHNAAMQGLLMEAIQGFQEPSRPAD